MIQRLLRGTILTLCLVAPVFAAPRAVTRQFERAPLGEVLRELAAAAERPIFIEGIVPLDLKVTVAFDGMPADQALRRVLSRVPDLTLEDTADGYRVALRERATPNGAPPTRAQPAPPPTPTMPGTSGGFGAPSEAGGPTLARRTYYEIDVAYTYAPGLAAALGGRPLRLQDVDPWAGQLGFGGGGLGGTGGGFGGGANGTPATGGGFGGQGLGGAYFELPDGITELVGVDWLNSLIAR